jgi:hypothetical protein
VQQHYIVLSYQTSGNTAERRSKDAFIDPSHDRKAHDLHTALCLYAWELLFILHGQDSDLMSARSQRVHKPFGVNG